MLILYKIKEFLKRKFKLSKENKSDGLTEEERQEILEHRKRRLEEKERLCYELIEEIKGLEVVIQRTESKVVRVTEEEIQKCIEELEKYATSDRLEHVIAEETYESLGATITHYFTVQDHKVILVTKTYDEGIAAAYRERYRTPEEILTRFHYITEDYSSLENSEETKKGMK